MSHAVITSGQHMTFDVLTVELERDKRHKPVPWCDGIVISQFQRVNETDKWVAYAFTNHALVRVTLEHENGAMFLWAEHVFCPACVTVDLWLKFEFGPRSHARNYRIGCSYQLGRIRRCKLKMLSRDNAEKVTLMTNKDYWAMFGDDSNSGVSLQPILG